MQRIALKWRALVFVAVIVIVLTVWVKYDTAALRISPYRNFLGSTWYGPLLLLLIPISLGWLSLAASRRGARVLGLVCSGFVFLIALFFIYIGKLAAFTLPEWLQLAPHI